MHLSSFVLRQLEKCSERDRELDALIEHSLGMSHGFMYGVHETITTIGRKATLTRLPFAYPTVKHYTSSLDAAMTLVPEGYTPMVYQDSDLKWRACVRKLGVGTHISWPERNSYSTGHRLAAIALTYEAMLVRTGLETT